jgi:hypothetical protein
LNRQETIDLMARIEKLEKSYARLYDAVFGDYSHEGPPLVERIMELRQLAPSVSLAEFASNPLNVVQELGKRGPGRPRKDATAT